jgi:Uma2 family endonuclease
MTVRRQYTIADLLNFPDDGSRYEVIQGELYVTAAPHFRHQAALNQIGSALTAWSMAGGGGLPLPGAGVIFSINTGVIPDYLWVSDERLPLILIDPATGEQDGTFHAAPDLVVEILSPGRENEERDRETKLSLYSRRGVREYWLIDYRQRTVVVYRRTNAAALELATTLMASDRLTSPLLPGFVLAVEQIFHLPGTLQP